MQLERSEQSLILAAKNGDQNAFGHLYELYFERVYRYVRGLLGGHPDAEDVTAEVFIKVLKALPRYTEKGHFTAWLFRIARNETFNHRRKGYRRKETPLSEDITIQLEDISIQDDPEGEIDRRELLGKTFEAMHYLTDLQREVLTLRFGEDLSLKETAGLMGRSIEAVKALQVSALRALRRQLGTDQGIKRI